MADPLFLSLWLRGYSPLALSVYLKKVLSHFPFSKLEPLVTLRVYALSFQEAPQLEEIMEGDIDIQDIVARAQHFIQEDCAVQVETRWDIYQWDGDWTLKPARVFIEVYGPEFESGLGEHARVDFDDERLFLPQEKSDQLRPVQSNIRSLLHLVQDLETEFAVEKRLLWSEEDENFAERLRAMIE